MKLTNKEAIANLNHIYGIVSPDIQRSLDVAFKALEERPQGEWKLHWISGHSTYECNLCGHIDRDHYKFCANCGAKMEEGAE